MTEAKAINFGTYNSNVFSGTCTRILGTSASAGALGPPQEQISGGGQLG